MELLVTFFRGLKSHHYTLASPGADFDHAIVNGKGGVTADVNTASIEVFTGNIGDDIATGAGAKEILILRGRCGADELTGGEGAEHLFGAADNSILNSVGRNDFLRGGFEFADAFEADTCVIFNDLGCDRFFSISVKMMPAASRR